MKQLIKKVLSLAVNYAIAPMIPTQKTLDMSIESAEECLQNHHPDANPSVLCNHTWGEPEYDLTIIIPVYNVEKYLRKCLDSVINQNTQYRYKVVVVNDGATDGSAAVLKEYEKNNDFFIVEQENRGLSGARNTGFRYVNSKYIMFLDSDDYLTETAVEKLLDTAYRIDADIVQGGYYDFDGETEAIIGCKVYSNSADVPSNGVLAGMAWGKVFKPYLFENICFPERYWFEDTIITGLITHLAKNIATVSDMVYFYRRNNAGITRLSVGKPKSIDTFYVHRCVLKARKELGMQTDLSKKKKDKF